MSADTSAQVSSRPNWHARHGSGEFKIWQKEHPSEHISYDDWKSSPHGKGLSLYYAALHIWEESDSSVSLRVNFRDACLFLTMSRMKKSSAPKLRLVLALRVVNRLASPRRH